MNPLTEAARLINQRHRERHFYATVVSTDGTKINIRRDSSSQTEGPYNAAEGLAAAVSADDRVLVVDPTGNGGYCVLVKVT